MDALTQLTSAHDDLLESIQKLEAVTQCDKPDPSELGMVRWKLTRASRSRWRVLDDVVYPEIERRSLARRPDVIGLRSAEAAIRANSSNHIARWDAEGVLRQWPDYRAASADMVASMRDRVAEEKTVLYPLLTDGTESSTFPPFALSVIRAAKPDREGDVANARAIEDRA